MTAENATLTQRKPTARSRVSNGRDLLPGVDGRSPTARRFRDIAAAIVADQRGVEVLSEARVQLIRRFAASACLAENLEAQLVLGESIDVAEHAALCSTMVRIGSRIGIDRIPRDIGTSPTLRDVARDIATQNDLQECDNDE